MSLFQTFNIGVTGIQGQGTILGTIADNIANINTVGYKKTTTMFRNLIGYDNNVAAWSPSGAATISKAINNKQGVIIRTVSSTDLAIVGNGFFAVSQTVPSDGSIFYTRAGAFQPNADGNFVNGAGFFLQGWPLDNDGNLPAAVSGANVSAATAIANLQAVNILALNNDPIPTTTVSLQANLRASQSPLANSTVTVEANLNAAQLPHPTAILSLSGNLDPSQTAVAPGYDGAVSGSNMASGAVTPHFLRTAQVLDNAGNTHTLKIGFVKTAANTWGVEVYVVPGSDVTQPDGLLASGTLTFNTDGTLASASTGLTTPFAAGWLAGGSSTLTLDAGTVGSADGMAQATGDFTGLLTAGPDYDPAVSGQSMSSGAVTPDFTDTVTVVDNEGTTRTLRVGYLKTGVNEWSIEIYGVPLTDITAQPGFLPGQVAYGTATFGDDGKLDHISPSLSSAFLVGWNGDATVNSLSFNWNSGNGSDGITQLSAASASSMSGVKNYDPADPLHNMAEGGVAPNFTVPLTVIDSAGVAHDVIYGFLKTGTNNWAVEIYSTDASEVTGGEALLASGIITFNGDATLHSISDSLSDPLDISWVAVAPATDPATNTITFDWGTAGDVFGTPGATVIGLGDGLTQFDSAFNITRIDQDGSEAGQIASVHITEEGVVVGSYLNGLSRNLYKIPLASFSDPNLLQSFTGNVFQPTNETSEAIFYQADTGPTGKILSEALEGSNAELETQFTAMIIAQRAYQNNTKIITTSDGMLQRLTEMVG